MTVVSLRVKSGLDRAVRTHALRLRMSASQIVALILEHSFRGHYNLRELPDVRKFLDAKLDVRLADELVSKLQVECQRLQISVSVYIRTILYAFYTKRLVFVDKEGNYTLEENHAGKVEAKSA